MEHRVAPEAPRCETGLTEPPASATYASQVHLRTLPYSAGRHVENLASLKPLIPYPSSHQNECSGEIDSSDV